MSDAPAVRTLERGAMPLPDGGTRFSVWAPNARLVEVVLARDGRSESHALARDDGGAHTGIVRRVPPGTDYSYRLDGGAERPDPVSRWRPQGVHGPSRVVDPEAFQWTDAAWRGIEMADLVIYELHVGTFTQPGTFDGVIERLPSLRELGITALEIMPVAEFPGARNWGYDGVSPYAVQSSYGGPNGLKRLVDAAHRDGPRGAARRGVQPSRPGRQLPPRARVRISRTATRRRGGTGSTSTDRTATKCVATWWTTPSTGSPSITWTGFGSTPPTASWTWGRCISRRRSARRSTRKAPPWAAARW